MTADKYKKYYQATTCLVPPWTDQKFKWSTLFFFDILQSASVPYEVLNSMDEKDRPKRLAILMEDTATMRSEEWGSTIEEQHVRSILGVPVYENRAPRAVLLCDNLEEPSALNDQHVKLMEFASRALEGVFQRHSLRDLERKQLRTEMDFLVVENFLLDKTVQPPWNDDSSWQDEFELD